MNYSDPRLLAEVIEYEHDSLKRKRFEHCVRVAETSRYMCSLYGLDGEKAYFAGLVHDICKYMSAEEMTALAVLDGKEVTEAEKENISLLHGRAGAVLIQQKFNITDSEIIGAVAMHTCGDENMTGLQKVIFAADKIEPGRENVTDEWLNHLFSLSLDELCAEIVQNNVDYLKSKNKEAAPETFRFLKDLQKNINEKSQKEQK